MGVRRLLVGGLWILGSQVVAALALLVGTRLITDAIPPATFGAVSLLCGVSIIGVNVGGFPLTQALYRLYPEAQHDGQVPVLRRALWRYLNPINVIFGAVVLGIGFFVGHRWSLSPSGVVAIVALTVIDLARTVDSSFANAAHRQRLFAVWMGADACIRPLMALLLLYSVNESAATVVWGYVLGSSLLYILFHGPTIRGDGPEPTNSDPVAMRHRLLSFAIPLVPMSFVSWTSYFSDRYVIGALIGLEQAGIYVAAYALASRPFVLLGGVLTSALRSAYFEAVSKSEPAEARRILRTWLLLAIGCSAVGLLLLWGVRNQFVSITLNTRYRSTADLLVWIGLGHVFQVISQVFGTVSLGHRKSVNMTIAEVSGAALSVAVGVPMIWRFGVLGAAWAVPIYYGAQLVIAERLSARFRRYPIASAG